MLEGIPNFDGRVPLEIVKAETGAKGSGTLKFISAIQLATPIEKYGRVIILYSRKLKPRKKDPNFSNQKFNLEIKNIKFFELLLNSCEALEDGRLEIEFAAEWWETTI